MEEVSSHTLTCEPSLSVHPRETLDSIEESGVFARNLGTGLVARGFYKIVTPVDFTNFLKALTRVRMDSQNFFRNYSKSVHSRKWAPGTDHLKEEIYDMIIHAVDDTRAEIERVETMFQTLSYAFRPPTSEESRIYRGWVDGIGDLFSTAFGLTTHAELEAAENVNRATQADLVRVLHSNEELVTLMQNEHSQVETVLKHQETLRNATQQLLMQVQYQAFRSDEARRQGLRNYLRQRLNQYHSISLVTINAIGDQVGRYFSELGSILNGRVNPTFIHPETLKQLIQSVALKLPKHLIIPTISNDGSLHQYYGLLKPELIQLNSRKILVLRLPLLRRAEKFDITLVTVFQLPIFHHLNATSTLKIRNNQIYMLHKKEKTGYYLSSETLTGCTKWGEVSICEPKNLVRSGQAEVTCLQGILYADKKMMGTCEKKVEMGDLRSQVEHLVGANWAYSVRGNLSILENCHDGRGERGLFLSGMGKIRLREGCTFRVGDREVSTPITLRLNLNATLVQEYTPVRVPSGFLATSMPWEGVRSSDVQPVGLKVLKELQGALADEATFHLDGTALKKKTGELLMLTKSLIERGEIEAVQRPWFTPPSNNDYLYLSVLAVVVACVTIFLYRRSRPVPIDVNNLKELQALLREQRGRV